MTEEKTVDKEEDEEGVAAQATLDAIEKVVTKAYEDAKRLDMMKEDYSYVYPLACGQVLGHRAAAILRK